MGHPTRHPGNTVASSIAAFEAGADMVEIDVSMSSDGHAVAIHGPLLEYTTTGRGPVEQASLGQMRTLGVTLRGEVVNGAGVPLVDEIVAALPDAAFNFDLKTPRALAPVLDIVERHGLRDRCVITGARGWQVGRVRRAGTDVAVLINLNRFDKAMARSLLGAWWLPVRYARLLTRDDVLALNVRHKLVSTALARRVHRLGAELWCFTVDDPDRVGVLRELGVDSITTNQIGRATTEGW
jgi:glycerophosphoryl diester phosphodiesterase